MISKNKIMKLKPVKKVSLLLAAILVLAFTLRIYQINEPPLYGDKLTLVYDAYSLLKTGHDQTGKLLPITFSLRERSPAGYVYFSIPFVFLFGPTALGVRSLSIISGLGIVLLMFFLGKRLFSQKVGLIAAFLTAVSPWSLSLSRAGFETHFALFLVLLGTVFFLYAEKKPWRYIGFVISWGLSIHTYPTYKIVLFIFLPFLIIYVGNLKKVFTGKSRVQIITSLIVGSS